MLNSGPAKSFNTSRRNHAIFFFISSELYITKYQNINFTLLFIDYVIVTFAGDFHLVILEPLENRTHCQISIVTVL